jgi:oxygen-independent coproporphyrinogen-3 oxidase
MCNFELDFAEVGAEYGIPFAEYFAPDLAALTPLAADGLVELDGRSVRVTARGRLLVRTVAMQFDRYLREAQAKAQYSKVI